MFDGLVPLLQPYAESFYRWCEWSGLQPRVTSVRRSAAQQEALYAKAQKGDSIFPAAPPGRSLHQLGLAFDMVTANPKYVGANWKRLGGFWSPTDWVHFEYKPKNLIWNDRLPLGPGWQWKWLRTEFEWQLFEQVPGVSWLGHER